MDKETLLNRIATRIRQSLELPDILRTTVREIRIFLDTDRVKIYRFAPDGSGEVIAESIKGKALPSMLGLWFPTTDIPPSSREMFIKVRQRAIVDVFSGHKILNQLDSPDTGETLVNADIRYAPVDPCHAEYLRNMGVSSSLTIPILHQKHLWGLLVSHHVNPRRYSERELTIVQLLVDQLSIAIAQSELLQRARQQGRNEAAINKISGLLHSPLELSKVRQTVLNETVAALQADGGRLYINPEATGTPAQLYTYGTQPQLSWIEETDAWQKFTNDSHAVSTAEKFYDRPDSTEAQNPFAPSRISETAGLDLLANNSSHISQDTTNIFLDIVIINDLYKSPLLQPLLSAFKHTQILSILIVPLNYHKQCVGCLTFFRHEMETETLWAGRQNFDERNRRPRASFDAWRDVKKGVAKTWKPEEIKLAKSLGTHLYMAIVQRRVENMIRHQASHDQLTGLANRLLFNERLSLALANAHQRGEMLAAIFLDLDGFKNINDTLGHAIGDLLLKLVANRLIKCIPKGNTLARWGGDEFTLAIDPIKSTEDATKIADKILDCLKKPFILEDREFYVQASLGIALAPYDGEDAETLLKNADAAMYRAKQQGRNHYQLYTPILGSTAFERLVLENNLYKALERNEFRLHYQPQIDLKTGQIVGMEALIRWEHPEQGSIVPDRFISLAEENGLICPIGEWVMRTASSQNRAWQLAGLPPIRIGVNLSVRQFRQNNLPASIAKILAETGLAPRYLELEVTESIAMQDTELTIALLQELQNMGIQIAIDDFGTGYSSLSSLKHFPVNKLKIDRSFVRELTKDSNDAAIVKAVIALGHGLNLEAIAEGVETFAQLEFLRSVNCDGVQGYLFSKPLPSEAATALLRQSASRL